MGSTSGCDRGRSSRERRERAATAAACPRNPTRATARYGPKIVEFQIDAAVRQILQLRETGRVSR